MKGIILLIALCLSATAPAHSQPNGNLPTASGTEAVKNLKKSGQYEALMEAARDAGWRNEQPEEPASVSGAVGQTGKVTADAPANQDQFGYSVAVNGDTAIIGAPLDDGTNSDQGSAYIFVRTGSLWLLQQKLVSPVPLDGAQFGSSVGINGDTVIVGAPFHGAGAVWIFVRSGGIWSMQQRIDPTAGLQRFGWSVAIDGNTAAIGAPYTTVVSGQEGATSVHLRTGGVWTLSANLIASDPGAGDNFGHSVAISSSSIIVGAPYDDGSGSAYVFAYNGTAWNFQQKLLASVPSGFDYFGFSVDISGDTAVVGAPATPIGPGAAYVFLRIGTLWSQQQRLVPSDVGSLDGFGQGVSISGDSIVVGSYRDDEFFGDQGSIYLYLRSGTVWSQRQKLIPADAAANDFLGYAVSIDGSNIIAGAPFDDSSFIDQGSAYFFRFLSDYWAQEPQVLAPDGGDGDQFGTTVAINGDTAIIGAPGDNTNSGSAYVFVRSNGAWVFQRKFLGTSGEALGCSVAIQGDTVFIGANRSDGAGGIDQGSVAIYTRVGTTWNFVDRISASDGVGGDLFGSSIAVNGNNMVIGAYGDDSASGSAYYFQNLSGTWGQNQKLTVGSSSGDQFGWSVAINRDTIIVGANLDTVTLSNQGSAYVFRRPAGTWVATQQLLAINAGAFDNFGNSMAVTDDTLIIGAYADDGATPGEGSAHVFTRSGSTWTPLQKLTASDAGSGDLFGASVAIHGETAVIGAYGDDGSLPNQGSAYVFSRSGTTWAQTSKLTASNPGDLDLFGQSVGIWGDKIVVGSPLADVTTAIAMKSDSLGSTAIDQGAAYFFLNTPLAPTAANVMIVGRLVDSNGMGVRNAVVTMTGRQGVLTARSNSFGYFIFDEARFGETYVLTVSSRRYQFEPRVLTPRADITEVELIASPE